MQAKIHVHVYTGKVEYRGFYVCAEFGTSVFYKYIYSVHIHTMKSRLYVYQYIYITLFLIQANSLHLILRYTNDTE